MMGIGVIEMLIFASIGVFVLGVRGTMTTALLFLCQYLALENKSGKKSQRP
jgi:hypothetical protein